MGAPVPSTEDGAERESCERAADEGVPDPGVEEPACDPPAFVLPAFPPVAGATAAAAAVLGSFTATTGESGAGAGTSVGAMSAPADANGVAPCCPAPKEPADSLSTRVPQPDSRDTEIAKAVTEAEI